MTDAVHDSARAHPNRYTRRTGIIETDLGAELILLDPATEEMFSLNDVGRLIWRELDETPVEAIVDRVVGEFDVSHDVAAVDVRALLQQLLDARLAVAAG
jgi:hypothetical protein